MKGRNLILEALPDSTAEKIHLEGAFDRKKRGFAAFLICCALLVAAFAVTALWQKNGGQDWFGAENTEDAPRPPVVQPDNMQDGTLSEPSPSLPDGAIPIIPMDLSYISYGKAYMNSEIDYSPDLDALLAREVGSFADTSRPLVLILHTHTSESYLPQGSTYIEGALGDLTYSRDAHSNVLAVGEALAQTLNEKGISTIHCRVIHDEKGLSGSYQRSEETVRHYLEQYPTIEYVIDLHRDSVIAKDGSVVRSEGTYGEESVAQVMAVVGSDRNGTSFESGWEGNLALALQLREGLNANGNTVARPISLRRSSFNQELAKYSLLLEIGTAANSPEEAKRAAVLVGNVLAELIQAR
ncbi:MAG: stage II sporulation protein P [Clostridia bacterium]|nr:stage II sporulation protein P [Clostridia bacterium]